MGVEGREKTLEVPAVLMAQTTLLLELGRGWGRGGEGSGADVGMQAAASYHCRKVYVYEQCLAAFLSQFFQSHLHEACNWSVFEVYRCDERSWEVLSMARIGKCVTKQWRDRLARTVAV